MEQIRKIPESPVQDPGPVKRPNADLPVWSPLGLTNSISSQLDLVYRGLVKVISHKYGLRFSALALAIFLNLFIDWLPSTDSFMPVENFPYYRRALEFSFRVLAFLLAVTSFIPLHLLRRPQVQIGLTAAALVVFALHFSLSSLASVVTCIGVLGAAIWLGTFGTISAPILVRWLVFWAVALGMFFFEGFMGWLTQGQFDTSALRLISLSNWFLFASVLLMAQQIRVDGSRSYGAWIKMFSPQQLIYPYPYSLEHFGAEQERKPVPRSVHAAGLLNIVAGIMAILAALFVRNYLVRNPMPDGILSLLSRGWTNYLFYYFTWMSGLHIGTGIGRWLGFNLPNGSHFALLAADPVDRWRRWNMPYYDWFLSYLFLPMSRLTRSIAIGAIVVFLINFLKHSPNGINEILFSPGERSTMIATRLQSEAIFYLAHLLVIGLAIATRKYWPSERRVQGWFGVLATHILMAITHAWLVL